MRVSVVELTSLEREAPKYFKLLTSSSRTLLTYVNEWSAVLSAVSIPCAFELSVGKVSQYSLSSCHQVDVSARENVIRGQCWTIEEGIARSKYTVI